MKKRTFLQFRPITIRNEWTNKEIEELEVQHDTVVSALYRGFQSCCFWGIYNGTSALVKTKSSFVTNGLSAFEFRCRKQLLRYLETKSSPQEKNNRLTSWWKNDSCRAEKKHENEYKDMSWQLAHFQILFSTRSQCRKKVWMNVKGILQSK